jgi:polysaccharide deacetylase 2 family uncharacterized protein YibQ
MRLACRGQRADIVRRVKRYLFLLLLLGGVLGFGLGQWLGETHDPSPRPKPPAPTAKPMPPPVPQPETAIAPPPPAVTPPVIVAPAADPPAWRRYAARAPAAEGRPVLAIVIDDLGLQPKRLAQIAMLPGPLTFAFLPYGVELNAQVETARARGHEVIVHLPMEPLHHEDPGPNALVTGLERGEFDRRLHWSLGRFGGYVGVNNHMGSKYTRDALAMAPVITELKTRGLLFLDSRTVPDSIAADAARKAGVPTASRDVFLDFDQAPDKVRAELERAEALARQRGAAVAIGHPHDTTIAVLAERLPSLIARGVVLVPISAIVARKLAG